MSERRYVASCRGCGNERSLSRGVVLTGKIPVCDTAGCGQYMDVYAIDPRPPALRHKEMLIDREALLNG